MSYQKSGKKYLIAFLAAMALPCSLPGGPLPGIHCIPVFISEHRVSAAPLQGLEAQELFSQAYGFYCQARPMTALGEGSKPYAEAIRSISQAASMEPENVDYLLLASQIYRGKGGISYAKEYFNRAEAVLQKRLAIEPNSISANLDYAILCYAGDVRYWPNYNAYLKKAREHANRVLFLCEEKRDEERFQLQKALAYLIKGDNSACEKTLKSSKNPTANFYRTLFQDTVKKKKWFWPAKNTEKEFLLYYMTDPSR